jgi:putative nucleotidyltransferase with HDIG domain
METSRHSLIFGLSYALDIAGKNNLSHSKSTAYLAVCLGRTLGLEEEKILELYYAALLHDIGLSNTYQMIPHCLDGRKMLENLPLAKEIPRDVYYHHEFYDGTGLFGLRGEEIPLAAAIVCFASLFDDTFGKERHNVDQYTYAAVSDWLYAHKAKFSGLITDSFQTLLERDYFLLDYFNAEIKYFLSDHLVLDDEVRYGYEDILKFSLCFADIIDQRSPFTCSHSHGIASLARQAASGLGYDLETQNKMYIAGLLHDIGKLHVSMDIIHKNGPLTVEERFEIRKHPYYTRKILEQIDGFEDITEYAANHHERVDGTGYPYKMAGEKLGELERAMAICDVFQALTEKRPYREQLPGNKVWSIIDGMAGDGHIDGDLAARVKTVFSPEGTP